MISFTKININNKKIQLLTLLLKSLYRPTTITEIKKLLKQNKNLIKTETKSKY